MCSRCDTLIAHKNIEYEKMKLQVGQFNDPFNLYGSGTMQFQQKEEKEAQNQLEFDIISNQKQIYAYLYSLKERIAKRASEIL